ncbi:hypothetical protein ACWDAO_06870 [Streptomyces sp. NPDC001212]|uniref:hypothetical protein n=1 Tax=Streptomyces sp. HYC2 TaxID=2955207 RepID=UPI00248074D5|nr:hypothetical protein [Streptomyces sp. HYC2]
MDENGVAVEVTEPVRYVGTLGTPAEARAFRFYADDVAQTVAELRAGGPSASPNRIGDTPSSAAVDHAHNR